jgi:hypothetical protein
MTYKDLNNVIKEVMVKREDATIPLVFGAMSELPNFMIKNSNIDDVRCKVVDYHAEQFTKYDTTYIRTVLTFADGSKESVECPADKADAYYGFTTCYAKHITKKFLGKNISDIVDYWLITKPKREAEVRAKAEIQKAEEQRLTERDKKRREKYRIRMEAIRRKEAYEATKLAEERYGVPADWSEK